MMYAIHCGNVSTYTGGCDPLVYLVTTVERVAELGLQSLFTDRNAVLKTAQFSEDPQWLDRQVDWTLMGSTMWNNTAELPDRRERRMAECLVHDRVPWKAFTEVVARTEESFKAVQAALATVGATTAVAVRPAWYF
jgi:hypothetical protein